MPTSETLGIFIHLLADGAKKMTRDLFFVDEYPLGGADGGICFFLHYSINKCIFPLSKIRVVRKVFTEKYQTKKKFRTRCENFFNLSFLYLVLFGRKCNYIILNLA